MFQLAFKLSKKLYEISMLLSGIRRSLRHE
jgi:hypothetical protein